MEKDQKITLYGDYAS